MLKLKCNYGNNSDSNRVIFLRLLAIIIMGIRGCRLFLLALRSATSWSKLMLKGYKQGLGDLPSAQFWVCVLVNVDPLILLRGIHMKYKTKNVGIIEKNIIKKYGLKNNNDSIIQSLGLVYHTQKHIKDFLQCG